MAFRTSYGHFKFLIILFGAINVPAIIMNLMIRVSASF